MPFLYAAPERYYFPSDISSENTSINRDKENTSTHAYFISIRQKIGTNTRLTLSCIEGEP